LYRTGDHRISKVLRVIPLSYFFWPCVFGNKLRAYDQGLINAETVY
jgi:hypothetical protein